MSHPDLQFLQLLAHLPPPLRQAVHRVRKRRPPCLLCGGRGHALGVFVPHDPAQWGIAPGMQGGCVYALCTRCVALPDRADRAEAVLWQHRRQDLLEAQAPWN